MAYDEKLAERVRQALAERTDLREQKMFGGIAFMVQGNMCCGVISEDVLLRIGPEQHEDALSQPFVKPMEFTGRSMRGFVFLGPGGYGSAEELARWVDKALAFVLTLPAK